jgi:hypothetical protein
MPPIRMSPRPMPRPVGQSFSSMAVDPAIPGADRTEAVLIIADDPSTDPIQEFNQEVQQARSTGQPMTQVDPSLPSGSNAALQDRDNDVTDEEADMFEVDNTGDAPDAAPSPPAPRGQGTATQPPDTRPVSPGPAPVVARPTPRMTVRPGNRQPSPTSQAMQAARNRAAAATATVQPSTPDAAS